MWLLSVYKTLRLRVSDFGQPALVCYSDAFYYTIQPWSYKRLGGFCYVNSRACRGLRLITFETKTVRFRYVGKAYRISKKGSILALNLHYPTFKYVIWQNLKLYHRKKKRKIFKFKILTSRDIKQEFFKKFFFLRVPDTYTRRGIINNLFGMNVRKQKAATHR